MIKEYINLNSIFRPALFHPASLQPLSLPELSGILTPSLAKLELSEEQVVPVPRDVQAVMGWYRPTPLFRALNLERAIGTSCRLYFKDEGETPTGNHKINSAYLIAGLCRTDGVRTVTTETTGNWGIALAMAATRFGLRVICFIDSDSHGRRPDRRAAMEAAGAEVHVVQRDARHRDLLSLTADAGIQASRSIPAARYVFGSVYNYFVIAQSVVGIEARSQMAREGEYPDVVVGCCGGGANFLGLAGAFLLDRRRGDRPVRFLSAESEWCPILTRGIPGVYSVDTLRYYPSVETLGLPGGLLSSEYIGGLGSTIVAPPVAHMWREGLLDAAVCNSEQASRAARMFYESERRWLALESAYTVSAVLDLARRSMDLRILANISTCESDRTCFDAPVSDTAGAAG